ncbi:MAG: hypothetical protein JXX29_08140 [Deltaproteobacteria bacterium]|nr:hypothetical protein [Deltaproteobacteria bacterium]MBN2671629.1 hypothetical protein [Deltaproteobacteria bacterium]
MMERKIRVIQIHEQDDLRREDMLNMSPEERVTALITMRDHMYPYQPIEKKITIRQLF